MTTLSWQPPPVPVTKCGECPKRERNIISRMLLCCVAQAHQQHTIYQKNKDGITESCPMWQQQNKDKL